MISECLVLCDIRFMVCDCQCGISSVGIWSGIVYDCLIFTVWYVLISTLLFIPCWGIWSFSVCGYVTFSVWWCVIVRVVSPVLVSGLVQYMTV